MSSKQAPCICVIEMFRIRADEIAWVEACYRNTASWAGPWECLRPFRDVETMHYHCHSRRVTGKLWGCAR